MQSGEAQLEAAVTAVINAGVVEAQHQARRLAAVPTSSGAIPTGLVGNEDLLGLYLQSRAGLDVTREVVLQRRQGTTWQQIGAATGMTRQSAHERWAPAVRAILDRYATGELAHLAHQDSL